jgi:hypothetical protein
MNTSTAPTTSGRLGRYGPWLSTLTYPRAASHMMNAT